ncbi:hypothetical protein GCM10027060_26460 [Nesterenkonia halophila]
MGIPTKISIPYKCGHKAVRDLSDVEPGKRKSRARWYAQTFDCPKCFQEARQQENTQDSNQRALDATDFAESHELPELEGSDAQIKWASIIRHETVAAVVDDEGTDDVDAVLTAARQIRWAGWWMDNLNWGERKDNDMDSADFRELILTGPAAQAERDETHVETENDL